MSQAVEIDESDEPLTGKLPDAEPAEKVKQKKPDEQTPDIRTYKKRWLTLGLFVLYAVPSTCQWIQYAVISNIVARYYNVSLVAIDMTAITFMGFYVPFILPGVYFMDRFGLRWTAILGSLLTCVGSWIKVFSVSRECFWVTFLGQSVVASSQVFVLNVPGRLAACWFGSAELSTATSLGLFGTQFGVATGFLVSVMLVGNHEDPELIGEDLFFLFRIIAAITTVTALMVILFFQDEPPLPPSKIRAVQKSETCERKESFIQPVKRLLTNKAFIILCNSYGMAVGVLNVIATLLSQMVLQHFENGEKSAGQIGLSLTLMGTVGAVVFGMIIDKTHKFKETAVTVYSLTLCGQIFFAVTMLLEIKWMIYMSGMFLGFFLAGYLSLGYQLCVEYTYPEAEDLATGLLNVLNNVYGIIFVLGLGKLMETYGDLIAHVGLCTAILAGLIMTLLTKDEQRRQRITREDRAVSLLGLQVI